MLRIIGVLFLLSLLSSGCRKEKDETAPFIDFISPNSGLTFFLPDTLSVNATIEDDQQVQSVRLSLINSDAIAVGPSFTNTYSEQEVNFNVAFVIDDITLESGPYSLQITASDGENESKAFLPLTLIEVPRTLEGFMYGSLSGSQTQISYVLLTGEMETYVTDGGDYKVAISQSDDRLFLSSDESTLSAFIYPNGFQGIWSLNLEDDAVISDMDFDAHRNELLVTIATDGVRIFSRNGSIVGSLPLEADEEILDLASSDDEVWLSLRRNNGLQVLVTFFRDSGVRIEERLLSFQADILRFKSENELAMAVPSGDIKIFNVLTGGTTPIDVPGDEEIREMWGYLNELYILKGDEIYRLTAGQQVQILYSGTAVSSIQIDEVNGRLYFIENDLLRVFNLFPWIEVGSESLMPNSEKLFLLYNR
ncbi:MAG: hypothetical protein O2867_08815 [Bacteroidetes bacterium]|nr:hypothetical protein [Bacteroidota bacterium]